MIRRILICVAMALGGAVLGGYIGLAVLDRYILVAADGTRLPGCGNAGTDPGALLGLILGAVAGVWISRPRGRA